MNKSEWFGTIWIALAVIFTGVEIAGALWGRTLSWEVWRYVTGVWPDSPVPKWWKITGRILVGTLLVWLFFHLEFGWLSP